MKPKTCLLCPPPVWCPSFPPKFLALVPTLSPPHDVLHPSLPNPEPPFPSTPNMCSSASKHFARAPNLPPHLFTQTSRPSPNYVASSLIPNLFPSLFQVHRPHSFISQMFFQTIAPSLAPPKSLVPSTLSQIRYYSNPFCILKPVTSAFPHGFPPLPPTSAPQTRRLHPSPQIRRH